MTTKLMVPTVHLNGTSKQALLAQLHEVVRQCRHLQETLNEAAPNGRDYYPQGDDALADAWKQWRAWAHAVGKIQIEATEIYEKIEEQGR